jgi:NodT family efflux transporter outer membrane factor (OMF) lipoprotein
MIPPGVGSSLRAPALDRVIEEALRNSPSIAAAEAALTQARETLAARSGALRAPRVDARAGIVRERASAAALGRSAPSSLFTLHNASVEVAYTLDTAGGIRRQLEALAAQVDYDAFLLEAAYLTLSSNVVTTAVREASLRAQLDATRRIARLQREQLDLTERRFYLGAVARLDVVAQAAAAAQTEAALPGLEKALAQARHQLAIYAGKFPAEADLPQFEFAQLALPRELPVSVPSALVRQRPDIRAAEALLHAASAQVGVATANLYPQITLSGSYGAQALRAADLFDHGALAWSLGASLLQPLFHGGELEAERRAAVAAYDAAAARYRETVLQAFQNVADALRALELDAAGLKAQAEALRLAHESLELARKRYATGALSYLGLLNAQQQYQEARIGVAQAQAARLADSAALFAAMGGGWWNRPAAAPSSPDRSPPAERP